MINFAIKQAYSFQVYPAALLGNGFQNVVVMAIMDFESANREGVDPTALHVQVYPTLPAGTPNDPSQYTYVKLKMPNGDTTILGLPWIKEDTVEQITSNTITATITGVTAADLPRVKNALTQNGFGNIELSVS